MSRDYDNSNRAQQAVETTNRILEVAEEMMRRAPLSAITLGDVADAAGVSVQTVIRKFGGWEGLLEALAERVGVRIAAQRGAVRPGDVEGAVDNVIAHYEAEGDLVLQLLSQEGTSPFAAASAKQGREFHAAWVRNVFEPQLRNRDSAALDALIVATDLYTWRLLRRDLGRDLDEVRATMLHLVRGALGDH